MGTTTFHLEQHAGGTIQVPAASGQHNGTLHSSTAIQFENEPYSPLRSDIPTIAERFASAGYRTVSLASNSLLEAVVMAKRAAGSVSDFLDADGYREVHLPAWVDGDLRDSDERVVLTHNREELRRTLWDYVGIVRTDKRLERAAIK